MAQTIGLGYIISHLHRHLGIDHDTHPALFEACMVKKDAVSAHLAIEGLELLTDTHLGAISAVAMDREKLAQKCTDAGQEPHAPVYTARSEDYWSSVLIMILRLRFEGALTNPETAWENESEIFDEFLGFISPVDRENTAKVKQKMQIKLGQLEASGLIEKRQRHGADLPDFRATKWLVLRLTVDVIEQMKADIEAVLAARGGDVAEAPDDEDESVLADLFAEARPVATSDEMAQDSEKQTDDEGAR